MLRDWRNPIFGKNRISRDGFELVIGAPGNNMDAVQPARIYPNVHVGGLWWYNFRSSTYRQAMQVRLEAVPASKCALVASDARCIEWCYGKILLVKHLLADFLYDQITLGWIDRSDALWVAREWLHDAAARRYLPTGPS
jgi:glucuronate isomerase